MGAKPPKLMKLALQISDALCPNNTEILPSPDIGCFAPSNFTTYDSRKRNMFQQKINSLLKFTVQDHQCRPCGTSGLHVDILVENNIISAPLSRCTIIVRFINKDLIDLID